VPITPTFNSCAASSMAGLLGLSGLAPGQDLVHQSLAGSEV
jgi:hypothetical protein